MKENYFSLLIDSPTDSSVKNITIIIDKILFGGNQEYYLYRSYQEANTGGKKLCNLIEKSLIEDEIGVKHLFSICTDGATN